MYVCVQLITRNLNLLCLIYIYIDTIMHTQMCTLNVILHHLNYLWYGPGRPISLQGNSHTTCNLQWAKQPPKKTNKKARKNTLTFKDHHVVESRKRGKQVYQVFVRWTLPRALLPLPHAMQIQSPWYKNGIDSLDWIACVKYQFPLPAQWFFTKNLHIHVSGLLPPNISSPCDNLNTTNELDVANWTSAGTCIVHKLSAWCISCCSHIRQWSVTKWTFGGIFTPPMNSFS